MARVGCRLFLSVHNALSRRSLATANCSPWKTVMLPFPLNYNPKSMVAMEAAAQIKSVNWNKSYDLRTLYSPEINGKMVPTIKNIENQKINDVPSQISNIQCPRELLLPLVEVEVPPFKPPLEKQAARLIVIRRRKMKKHKLRKLRKRMRFEWAKKRQKREMRKEKAFQATLIEQIKVAEKFSAEEYIAMKLKEAYEPDIPQQSNTKTTQFKKW